jgi:hypothetical protein
MLHPKYKEFFLSISDAVKELGDDNKFIESVERILLANTDNILVSFFIRTNIPNFPFNKKVDSDGLLKTVYKEIKIPSLTPPIHYLSPAPIPNNFCDACGYNNFGSKQCSRCGKSSSS